MFVPVLYCILAVVSVAAALFCLYLYFKRRQRRDLVFDNGGFFLMVASALLMGGLTVYLVSQGEWQLSLVPIAVCVLCLMGLLSWHNEILVFDEEGFTRRNLFLRSTRYSYQDLTDCSERVFKQTRKHKEVQTLFYIGKKYFPLSRRAHNYGEFAKLVLAHGREGLDPSSL